MTQRKIQLEQLELSGSSMVLPAGVILSYGGASIPANFLNCNGAAVSRTTYAILFAALGTTYGPGNGSTTFNVPNMQGRVSVGKSSGGTFATLGSNVGTENVTLSTSQIPAHNHTASGTATGSGSHSHSAGTLQTNVAGSHQHGITQLAQTPNVGSGNFESRAWSGVANINTGPSGNHSHLMTGNTGNVGTHTHPLSITVNNSTGGGGPHPNIQPSLVVNAIISTGL